MSDLTRESSRHVDRGASAEPHLHPERLRFALDVGRTGIWNWRASGQEFCGDRGLALLWGLADGQSMSARILRESIEPDDAAPVFEALTRATAKDGPERCQLEFRIRRQSDDAQRWVRLQGRLYPVPAVGAPEPASDGAVELVGMARDVTSRKQRETHMHLLMREVTHRSKNLLAIIQAMARQTVKDSLTADEFERRFSSRLRGLAASHDLLAARDWHGAAMGDLVRWQLGSALDDAGDRVAISGPDLFLNPEAAQNIGLAFNELSSNALRFGALSSSQGRVSIAWSIDPSGTEPRRFHISWLESGGPEVSAPRRLGFGHKVVERLAARALDGNVSLTFASSGLQWSLHIPASFVVDDDAMPRVN
jgi:two-component sensor histidine kinase